MTKAQIRVLRLFNKKQRILMKLLRRLKKQRKRLSFPSFEISLRAVRAWRRKYNKRKTAKDLRKLQARTRR